MAKIAIVYHSMNGHTRKVAEAVERGAKQASDDVELIAVEDLEQDAPAWAVLDEADAIIFGSPTYMGSMSSAFKAFAEASAGRWFHRTWQDKLAAGFTTSGSMSGDKLNTLVGLVVLASQHGMIWVSLGLLPPNVYDEHGPKADDINRSGAFIGAMASSFSVAPEVSPSVGDVKTAEYLGERVATIARKHFGK
ncbi:NADPH-dependent FMN reductase [Granulicella sp. 5B5]|uniref:flavodoxin family protein n=1 Tax=Granulicella sp. 5B5 TaxID=1617967 RepID=UPI0015F45100|nr:flavodoxin family protein [Granulicella sp. 5B5]QMV18683.1 NADPH-dependent FMN reductase [Granulicella sp. 5B5]